MCVLHRLAGRVFYIPEALVGVAISIRRLPDVRVLHLGGVGGDARLL